MEAALIGVFGADGESKARVLASIAKKSEAEGLSVYTRVEQGRRFSFLDTSDFPERIQGYARIASISDHALFIYPTSGRLAAPDGELAVLLGSFGLNGTLEVLGGSSVPEEAAASLKGTGASTFKTEGRDPESSAIDLSYVVPSEGWPRGRTLVYVDRAFTVKGVGTVALGFVLSGEVRVHDQLRLVPGDPGKRADIRGIQINDVDFDSAARGIRVGLSLKGVDASELDKVHWLDDGELDLRDSLDFEHTPSPFYKHEVGGREMHIQLPGEMVPARVEGGAGGKVAAKFPYQVPAWDGMRGALLDLNAKSLRVAAGLTCTF